MKQKGLPLVSNKAAPCTVLSHSLVDSAPHVHQTNAQIQTGASHTTEPLTYGTSHILLLCYIFPSSTRAPPPITLMNQQVNSFFSSEGVQGFCSFIKMTLM